MNCALVNKNINELNIEDFAKGVANILSTECKNHIKSCEACESALQNHHNYLMTLSQIKTPEFTELEATAMLNKVVSNANTSQPVANNSGFLQGFIAASILAVSIFGAWNVFNVSTLKSPQIVSTAPDYYTTEVVLVIDAPEDMYDADLNLVLPQQLALEGYENIQELSWPVDLKAGTNTLTLPIRVNKHQSVEQQLSIMAKLYHYAEEHEFEIKVNLAPEQEDILPSTSTTRV